MHLRGTLVREDGVEPAARGDAVDALAAELRVVDDQVAPVRRVQHAAEDLGLLLVVGRRRLVVQPERRDERLRDVEARELLERRAAEDRVLLF